MTKEQLEATFASMRAVLAEEMKRPHNQSEENKKAAGYILLGIELGESLLTDLKRIADAQEKIAQIASDRYEWEWQARQ